MSARLRPDEYFVVTSSRGHRPCGRGKFKAAQNRLGSNLAAPISIRSLWPRLRAKRLLSSFSTASAARKEMSFVTPGTAASR
jgi:hypothetical protein